MGLFPLLPDCIPSLPSWLSLEGQVIVLTGASRGIGKEVAKQCVLYTPYQIILGVRSVLTGSALREELLESVCVDADFNSHKKQPLIHVLHLDLSSIDSVLMFVAEIYRLTRHIDVLLLNAATNDSTNDSRSGPLGFDKYVSRPLSGQVLMLEPE